MAHKPGRIPLGETDADELARCRRLQSDLRQMIAAARVTIARSRELVEIAKFSEFHGQATANTVDGNQPN